MVYLLDEKSYETYWSSANRYPVSKLNIERVVYTVHLAMFGNRDNTRLII